MRLGELDLGDLKFLFLLFFGYGVWRGFEIVVGVSIGHETDSGFEIVGYLELAL